MSPMAPTKPTLELLRSLSDEHVLRALMAQRQATRAEIAAATGLSKPTVSESVRRLSASGSVVDTGERTTGRGRVGTYYALARHDRLRAGGEPRARGDRGRGRRRLRPGRRAVAGAGEPFARRRAGRADAASASPARSPDGPFRLAVVSAADPVDRESGRLVELPDSPFLLGALDAPAVLAELVDGPVTVDNDVNWAARAEHSHGDAAGVRDFVYLFLGEGLGCAVVTDGEVRRGHAGLAGEIAYVMTVGPDGVAMRLTDVFAALGLRRPGTDRDRRAGAAARRRADAGVRHDALGRAVAGVLSAVVALTDPAVVLVGGPWGRHPGVLAAVAREFADAPLHVPVEAAAVTDEPSLTAARETALEQLRDAIVSRSSRPARR